MRRNVRDSVRAVVLERARNRCERCGISGKPLDMSHRQAKGMGGALSRKVIQHDRPANLNALCRPCHQWVEASPLKAYSDGWKVRRGLQPEDIPVPTWSGVWFLDNDGTYLLRLP